MPPANKPATDSSVEYFLDTAAPPGSALYYACLLTEPVIRPQVLALHALEHELLKSLTDIQDPGVARLRLQWWAEEIERAVNGQARHPLSKTLQPQLVNRTLSGTDLVNAIGALQDALSLTDRDDHASLETEYRDHFGPLWRLSAQLAGIDDDAALVASAELGGLHHRQRALLALPQTLAQGLSRPVPRSELAETGASVGQSLSTPQWRECLAQQFLRLQTRLDEAWRTYPPAQAARLLHCLILIRLDAALASEIMRDGCRIDEKVYALTPLRRLWLAWRTRREVLKKCPATRP